MGTYLVAEITIGRPRQRSVLINIVGEVGQLRRGVLVGEGILLGVERGERSRLAYKHGGEGPLGGSGCGDCLCLDTLGNLELDARMRCERICIVPVDGYGGLTRARA